MVSRSATVTVVATNANDGLVRPQLIERLIDCLIACPNDRSFYCFAGRSLKNASPAQQCKSDTPARLCKTRYNTTAPMYGVSLTSGQPVTIVQKFPDLLQQVVFEVCEWVYKQYIHTCLFMELPDYVNSVMLPDRWVLFNSNHTFPLQARLQCCFFANRARFLRLGPGWRALEEKLTAWNCFVLVLIPTHDPRLFKNNEYAMLVYDKITKGPSVKI